MERRNHTRTEDTSEKRQCVSTRTRSPFIPVDFFSGEREGGIIVAEVSNLKKKTPPHLFVDLSLFCAGVTNLNPGKLRKKKDKCRGVTMLLQGGQIKKKYRYNPYLIFNHINIIYLKY